MSHDPNAADDRERTTSGAVLGASINGDAREGTPPPASGPELDDYLRETLAADGWDHAAVNRLLAELTQMRATGQALFSARVVHGVLHPRPDHRPLPHR